MEENQNQYITSQLQVQWDIDGPAFIRRPERLSPWEIEPVLESGMKHEQDSYELCHTPCLSDQESIVEAAMKNGRNFSGPKQSNSAFCSFKTISSIEAKPDTKDSADRISVSESSLRSTCRKQSISHDIVTGLSCKRSKRKGSPSTLKHMNKCAMYVGTEEHTPDNRRDPCSNSPLEQASDVVPERSHVSPMEDVTVVMIKATYKDYTIRFPLHFSSHMTDLVEEVTKKLKMLKDRAFSVEYQDDDGDWVLIACDEDLQACMTKVRSVAKTKIRIKPKDDTQPSL